MKNHLTIGYFGNYNPRHSRNIIFIQCLKQAGYRVIEMNCREQGWIKYYKLIKKLVAVRRQVDCLIIGFPGQLMVLVARIFYRGPIVFNALLSLYDAMITDRKIYAPFGLHAIGYRLLDYLAGFLAQAVILDCQAYINFYSHEYRLSKKKFYRIFPGADEQYFKPDLNHLVMTNEIHYYSSFLPSHGTDVIVQAARLLEPEGIKFIFSGQGQCFQKTKALAAELKIKNIEFSDKFKSMSELLDFIQSSFVCLGLFGTNPKTSRAISIKVIEAIACQKPVITSRFSATEELLKDRESVLLVDPASSQDLANKILLLKNDTLLRQKISEQGYQQYLNQASYKAISRHLDQILSKLCHQ